jgi:HD-like signal output (HDOD) protein/CheY-like chemotaxis protein
LAIVAFRIHAEAVDADERGVRSSSPKPPRTVQEMTMSDANLGIESGSQVPNPRHDGTADSSEDLGQTSFLDVDLDTPPGSAPNGDRYRVMFVDDEAYALAGLRRMLHAMKDSWEMLFVSSGAEALELLSHERVDAIVSDMRMPAMNGAELLARVQDLYPSTARLVLSGQVDPDTVLELVRSAQQFLAKPSDARTLTSAVSRALSVQRSLNHPDLRDLIGGVTALPMLPAIYDELVTAVSSENVELSEIAAIVARDVATSVELLKLVNSAFFGLPREVYSVADAVRLLGLDNVQALVLASSLFRVNEALAWLLDIEELRSQSLRRAAIARAISRREGWTGRVQEVAVLSCMLRDVGRLVLTEGRPDAAARLHRVLEGEPEVPSPARLVELEIDAYGCSVPQASAYLLGLWGFAPAIVHTIASQPPTDAQVAMTKFEWVVAFATIRAADPGEHVALPVTAFMTSHRLQDWNEVADAVMHREHENVGAR